MPAITTTRSTRRAGAHRQRSVGPAEAAKREAERQAKLDDARRTLADGIARLAGSQRWRAMLATAARFHDYSWRNCLMILSQRPDATRVAGYRTWQSLGRQVRRGEPGIKIWAPCTYPAGADDTAEGATADDNEPDTTATRQRRGGWRIEHVWDISQTDGEALPEVAPALLTGQAPAGLWDALAAQVADCGFVLRREVDPSVPAANGSTTASAGGRVVRVRPELCDAQAVKTLTHELAHIACGHAEQGRSDPRSQVEVEAESVAFVVCAFFGLDASEYTFPYVAGWAGADQEVEAVTRTAETVVRVARQIIAAAEQRLIAVEGSPLTVGT